MGRCMLILRKVNQANRNRLARRYRGGKKLGWRRGRLSKERKEWEVGKVGEERTATPGKGV